MVWDVVETSKESPTEFVRFHSDCTESSLLMFMDGVDEFLKSFMEKINHVVTTEGKDLNVRLCDQCLSGKWTHFR